MYKRQIQGKVDDRFLRWYAVKLFERDDKVQQELKLDKALVDHIDQHIADCEKEKMCIRDRDHCYRQQCSRTVYGGCRGTHSGEP